MITLIVVLGLIATFIGLTLLLSSMFITNYDLEYKVSMFALKLAGIGLFVVILGLVLSLIFGEGSLFYHHYHHHCNHC
jgi:predicted transporter